uniref:HECT domain-containing protein n=1 Tax=Ciona savignyi TaxID=51511 RepID=H2Y8X1_CIOSA
DFLSYALSLMRSHTSEHSDLLPIVDVSALKHIAYVLDAYIFFARGLSYKNGDGKKVNESSRHSISLDIGYDNSENEDDDDDLLSFTDELYSVAVLSDTSITKTSEDPGSILSQPPHSFFRRSESMDFLGESDVPNLFEIPLPVALPLAEKPHLLQPSARKEDLFGRPRITHSDGATSSMGLSSRVASLVTKIEKTEMDDTSASSLGKGEPKAVFSSEPSTLSSSNFSPVVESVSSSSVDPDTQSSSTTITQSSEASNLDAKMSKDQGKTSSDEAELHSMHNLLPLLLTLVFSDVVLQRSRLTLELFSKVFLEDVGTEHKSILHELGGFEVRESNFRKLMEKLRAGQSIDLQLNVERSRDLLIQQTFKQLNQHFKRRSSSAQPMAVLRVKVIFKNEPGEGTGVARSFYTAISEALLSSDKLPPLDAVLPGANARKSSTSMHPMLAARLYKREQESEDQGRTARYRERNGGGRRGFSSSGPTPLLLSAPPYYKKSSSRANRAYERSKQAIGERLYPKVMAIHPVWVPKITGMLLGLPAYELLLLLRSERNLHDRNPQTKQAGRKMVVVQGHFAVKRKMKKRRKWTRKAVSIVDLDGSPPLFFQPGKRGLYAPTSWGEMNEARLNAYRNVGRLLGLCLLQNELCPLPLCRHVLKVILGRKVNWHDLAFFDPNLYESLRQLVLDGEQEDGGVLDALELTFVVDLQPEEGGQQVPLVPDGDALPVTKANVRDYVRKYALQRMLICCKKPLEKIRQGVYDVIPRSALQSLTAEDLRLLANGCGHVGVHTLISYTLFNDESGKTGTSAEKLTQFRRWFWSVVDRFSSVERQELLYFWTGSPALPASEDGFQPMPTITIRPPDDHHLPTANTCISRLYVPLYSSRKILKQKLSIAIKTKNFGFV